MKIRINIGAESFKEGHFIKGTMGPKIEASITFVKQTQGIAIITNPENALQAIKGEAGTRIIP